jgi:GT2 family glycosyltransferase
MPAAVSAYVPCFNNAPTIRRVLEALRNQTVPIADLFVVDDGSTDGSAALVKSLGVRLVRHDQNLGRGATRARAMAAAQHEFVLCSDATNALSAEFVERSLGWFSADSLAAVYGQITQPTARTAVDRWRGRYLFRLGQPAVVRHHALLSTYGTVVRSTAVREVGGYNPRLRHTEDGDLGERLLAAGWDVVYDPNLKVVSVGSNTLAQTLERYWRWNAGKDEMISWKAYLKQMVFSFRVMAWQDLRQGDPWSVPISLLSPHYQFWRSWWRNRTRNSRKVNCATTELPPDF